jgi:acyl carrier protein
MNVSTLELKLQHAFQLGLDLPLDTHYMGLEFAKSAHWDSVAHLQLIAAIEDAFGIMMDTNDVLAMNSYAKAIEIVRKYDPTVS